MFFFVYWQLIGIQVLSKILYVDTTNIWIPSSSFVVKLCEIGQQKCRKRVERSAQVLNAN